MRTVLTAVALVATLSFSAHAQNVSGPYVGVEGGVNWMFNKSFYGDLDAFGNNSPISIPTIVSFDHGWALGGTIGYDFIGPRVELEGRFHQNSGIMSSDIGGTTITSNAISVSQTSVMANFYYDFWANRALTPYVGAGAGLALVRTSFSQQISGEQFDVDSISPQFAYQYMMGVGYRITPNLRANLEGRYSATPAAAFQRFQTPNGVPVLLSGSYPNNNITVLASLQYKLGARAADSSSEPPAPSVQSRNFPGVYVGFEGGANWMLNTFFHIDMSQGNAPLAVPSNTSIGGGRALGGMVGYDFVGPRVEVEGLFRKNGGDLSTTFQGQIVASGGITVSQASLMTNVYYDFMANRVFTPYIGAGVGVALTEINIAEQIGGAPFNLDGTSTQFAYQYMMGVGYRITPNLRLNLEGRYFGTTAPGFSGLGDFGGTPASLNGSMPNNNMSVLVSLQYKFGSPPEDDRADR